MDQTELAGRNPIRTLLVHLAVCGIFPLLTVVFTIITILRWDNWVLVHEFDGGQDWFATAVSPGGRRAVTLHSKRIRIYDTASGELQREIAVKGRQIEWASFSPSGRHVCGIDWDGRDDCRLLVWDVESGDLAAEITLTARERPSCEAWAFFSPDGRWILVTLRGFPGAASYVYDWSKGTEALALRGGAFSDSFSPDGRCVITVEKERVCVLDLDDRRVLRTLDRDARGLEWAAYSPDGKSVVVPRPDGHIGICDVSTWSVTKELEVPDAFVARFSNDSRGLAVTTRKATTKIFGVESGRLLSEFPGTSLGAFFPDNRRLLLHKRPGGAVICDSMSSEEIRLFEFCPAESIQVLRKMGSVLHLWPCYSSDAREIFVFADDHTALKSRMWRRRHPEGPKGLPIRIELMLAVAAGLLSVGELGLIIGRHRRGSGG